MNRIHAFASLAGIAVVIFITIIFVVGCGVSVSSRKDIDYIYKNMRLNYPYVLMNGKIDDNHCEWEVKNDVSGIYLNEGRLKILKTSDGYKILAPNESIEKQAIAIVE